MNTNDLIATLAADTPVRRPTVVARMLPLLAATGLSLAIIVVALGIRADLMELAATGLFWLKCAFVGSLALIGQRAARISGVPGARLRTLPWLLAILLVIMAAAAAITLADEAAGDRARQVWGSTWRTCPLLIALLSLPIFAAMMYRLRGLAPTRLRLAGAIAGFAAGALAALLYCLHCPELSPSFVAIWYGLGILIPTVAGAAAGRTLLAW